MRVSTAFVLVPAVIVAAVIAVANRQQVTFRLDPFSAENPAIAFSMPLFLLVFLALLVGVLLGAATVALRRAARPSRPTHPTHPHQASTPAPENRPPLLEADRSEDRPPA